jgi:hypothetical protein
MRKGKNQILVLITAIVLVSMACSFPLFATPTPFVFPTPDMTMTALFAPTNTTQPTDTQQPTATPTETPQPTATLEPPTETPKPTEEDTEAPPPPQAPSHRSGPHFEGIYVKHAPDINGSWSDWVADEYPIEDAVFGEDHIKNSDDLSGAFMVEWDYDYLYVAWKVTDDKYVQVSKHANLYLGDSVDILVDTNVQYDYWNNWLDWDDYQIGFSPGRNEVGENMEAYLWFPASKEKILTKAEIGAKKTENGYRITVAIPWSTFGIDPYPGMRLGFTASISDDDSKNGGEQQSMVSSSWRKLTDPTTWGDLILVK